MITDKIKKMLEEEGIEYKDKEYDIIPDESLLNMPNIESTKMDEIIEKVEMGSRVALESAGVLIDYFSRIMNKNRGDKKIQFLVLSDRFSKNLYGVEKNSKTIKGEGEYITTNGKKLKHNLFQFKGKFTIVIAKDELWEEMYGKDSDIPTKARVIYAKDEERFYGWEEITEKSYSNPILALSYGLKKYGDKLGGVKIGKKYYPLPDNMINLEFMKYCKNKEENFVKKIYIEERIKNIKRVKNGIIYLMNFNGKVKEFCENRLKADRMINKEMIIGEEIFKIIKNRIKEGIDYYEIEGIKISNLAIILQALLSLNKNKEIKITLKYDEDSINLKANLKKTLRKATLKEWIEGDILIKPKLKKNEIIIEYGRSPKNQEFLTFSEKYLIAKINKKEFMLVF